jgi:tetratricopeptide (TPR) repeat protein
MKIILSIGFCFCFQLMFAQNNNKPTVNGDSIVNKIGLKKAIAFFEKELKLKPNNEEILRWLGALNLEDNNLVSSEMYYNKALKTNPNCAPCVKNIGRIYENKNDFTKAMVMFDKAINLDSTNAVLYTERGKLKARINNNLGARSDYNKAIKLDPKSAEHYYRRSMLNLAEGSNASALIDISTAIELSPTTSILYEQRAGVYYADKKLKEAILDMTEAIKLDSTSVVRYYNRAALYNQLGEIDNALNDYSLAIKVAPLEYKSYYYRANSKYQKEDMDSYCDDLKICYYKLKKINPKDSLKYELEYSIGNFCDTTKISFYYQRGVAYYNLAQFDDAVKIYTKGLQKFLNNSMSLSFRGNAFMRLFQYKNAITDYEVSSKNRENLLIDLKANQQHSQIDVDSIENYADWLIATNYNSMAECYFELGNYNEALQSINNAIYANTTIKVEKEKWFNVRGNIYMALGYYTDAKKDFDTSIMVNSTFDLAYVNRAIALMNAPSKVKTTSISIGGNFTNKIFTPKWTIPVNSNKTSNNVMLAIADCDRAIAISPSFGFAFYTRARINKSLGIVSFCRDFLRAKNLGFNVEPELMEGCKK